MSSDDKTKHAGSSSRKRSNNDVEGRAQTGFGMFSGVFTPCTLTILGVIMFLRYGYVVGNAGLLGALFILAAAKTITILTTISLSAIATNTKIKGGGAYYLISRSLGVEFGGAIGIVFFLAQAISVAMYVIGFTEAVVAISGDAVSFKLIAIIANSAVFICVFIGAGWTIRLQYFILAALVASLVSFFAGGWELFKWETVASNWNPSFVNGEDLFTMFALFFPAVTGIMAGANMSGELKNPSSSIPKGTFLAIVVTALVYGSMALFLSGTVSSETLTSDNMVVGRIAYWPVLITIGIFAATLSSALSSMMGAPRILQALARDTIFPTLKMFGQGQGKNNEPRRATILTFLISTACIVLADLNTIAPLITMAFMITYGTINLATFYEGITKNPSYRPTFKYSHWSTALVGTIGCVCVMFLMNWQWAIVSILLMAALYYFIYSKQVQSRWGDLNSGLLFERTRKNLLRLERQLYHPKNWRPIILAMSGSGWTRPHLAILGHWLTTGHGILNLGQVIQGNVEDLVKRIKSQEELLERFIVEEKLDAFPNIVAAPSVSEGIEYLVQCSGLGAVRPNTLLVGWPDEVGKAEVVFSTLRVIAALDRSVVIAKWKESIDNPGVVPEGTIDVWWRGRQNGELLLLLAHLLKQNDKWRNREIRLMRVVADAAGKADVEKHLNELAVLSRIEVESLVFVSENPPHVIRKQSANAAVTLMGFGIPEIGQEAKFFEQMNYISEGLDRCLFINSTGNMKLES